MKALPGSLVLVHLVHASLQEVGPARDAAQLLLRLIKALQTEGSFAADIDRQQGIAIHCRFELKTDAHRLARIVKAKPDTKYPGWQSQSGFSLDAKAQARIARLIVALPPVLNRRPHRRSSDAVEQVTFLASTIQR